MPKRELPEELRAGPFRVNTALAAGVTPKRLRSGDLNRSIWGVRASEVQTRTDVYAMIAHRMPAHAFFSHTTAAQLWGAPLPLRLERETVVHVSVPRGSRAPHARGISGHSLDVATTHVTATKGLRVTTPARTFCDLAAVLDLGHLVAVGDHLIQRQLPLCSEEELAEVAEHFRGKRGAAALFRALALLDARAESPPESRLRVILVTAGLPPIRVNYVIVSTEHGWDVRTDLAFVEFNLVLEYQGDYHRSRSQWRKDMTRRSRLEAQGWVVMELNSDDLNDPTELVLRVRTLLRRQGWAA